MGSDATQLSEIATLGALSSEGWAIEPLSEGRLVLWTGEKQTVAPTIEHAGTVYSPPMLDAALAAKLRLPKAVAEVHSCPEMIGEIRNLFSSAGGFDEPSSLLNSAWILSTWLADCLPGLPLLCLMNAGGSDNAVQHIFEGLCRFPVPISRPSVENLLTLPGGLHPTLVLPHPEQRHVRLLAPFTAEGGSGILVRGRLINLQCSVIATTDRPLNLGTKCLCLTPTCMVRRRFHRSEIDEIAERLRPALLRYRLEHFRSVRESRFDVLDFGIPTRLLAHTLAGVLEPYPSLQRQVVEALRTRDQDQRISAAERPATAVTEALIVACHENKRSIFVGEATQLANGIRFARGGFHELSPKTVGGLIRTQLGLSLTRRSQGYELILNPENRLHLHRVARALCARVIADPKCAECVKEASGTENDVHEVHRSLHEP